MNSPVHVGIRRSLSATTWLAALSLAAHAQLAPNWAATARSAFPALPLGASLAGEGAWSEAHALPGLTGRVFAVGRDGPDLVAGGQSFQTVGADIPHVARWDGSRWHAYGEGVLGTVRAITTFQGQLVVAGEFTAANGPATGGIGSTPGVARWDGIRWQPLGAGLELSFALEPMIFDLEVYGGELYAAGWFDRAGGMPIASIARWDGSRWADVGGGVGGTFEPKVLSLTVTRDGHLIAGGEFTQAGGVPVLNIAAWDGERWSALGPGLGSSFSSVFALVEHDGLLYAGGNFRSAGSTAALKVAAWDGTAWQPLGSGIPDWTISTAVYSLQPYQGDLYVGGDFVQAGGVFSRAVARWDGSAWHDVGGVEGSDLKTTAIAMTEWNGRLVVGGEFAYAGTSLAPGDPVVSTSIASFDGFEWGQLGHGVGFDGAIRDLCAYDGGVVAVGGFLTAGDQLSPRVAYWKDGRWRFLGYFDNGNVDDAFVWQGDLVVTGSFQTLNGAPIKFIARWDGQSWSGMGNASGGMEHVVWQGRLYAGGYDLRLWNGSSWELVPQVTITSGAGIRAMLVGDDGKLYLGGEFPVGPNVATWDGASFEGVGAGLPFEVDTLANFAGGIVAGLRTDWRAGSTIVVQRWDGQSWSPMGNDLNGSLCSALSVFDGKLYAGGDLILYAGGARDWIARWNGASWEALGTSGLDGPPFAFHAEEQNGRLWAAGAFRRADGNPAWNLARWELDTNRRIRLVPGRRRP